MLSEVGNYLGKKRLKCVRNKIEIIVVKEN